MNTILILIFIAAVAMLGRPLFVLAANRGVTRYVDQELRSHPVKAAAHVYKGAFVGLDASTGYARGLVAGDQFLGVAYEDIDNTSGAGGAVSVRVYSIGDFVHALAGAVITDKGKPVYASADDTLTFGAGGNSFVGWMIGLESSAVINLRIQTAADSRVARVVNKTQADTPVTLYAQDSGKIFKNLGASGQTTFSLPAAPPAGVTFTFVAVAAQEVRVDPGVNDGIFISGAKQADGKYVSFDDEGEHLTLISDENGDWVSINVTGTITVEA